MSTHTILPIPYFGPIAWWIHAIQPDYLVTLKEPFIKQTYRNRTCIMGSNKVQMLSIPVNMAAKGLTANEIPLVYKEKWPLLHVRSITAAYGKSPYFAYYMPYIEAIILHQHPSLSEINRQTFILVQKLLKVTIDITEQEAEKTNPVNFEEMANLKPYHQVFGYKHGFISNLSILDLLFNLGPESLNYLKNQAVR